MIKNRLSTNIRKTRATTTQLSSSTNRAKIAGGAVIAAALFVCGLATYQVFTLNTVDVGEAKPVEISRSSLSSQGESSERLNQVQVDASESPELEDQYSENYRLLAQRDIQNRIIPYFKKPSNYRDGYSCTLRYVSTALKDVDCGNEVHNRFALLALEAAGLDDFETPLTSKYTVTVRF